jgi:biopolymer transport protein ExbD
MRKHKKRRSLAADAPMMDINTTPLIDVMLVLLIMLIITIPIQLHAVKLNMPAGNPPPSDVKPEVVRIDIDALGKVRWNGELLPTPDDMERRMGLEVSKPVQPEVHLRPDRKALYAVIASILASAQHIGLTKIGVVGSEQFVE